MELVGARAAVARSAEAKEQEDGSETGSGIGYQGRGANHSD